MKSQWLFLWCVIGTSGHCLSAIVGSAEGGVEPAAGLEADPQDRLTPPPKDQVPAVREVVESLGFEKSYFGTYVSSDDPFLHHEITAQSPGEVKAGFARLKVKASIYAFDEFAHKQLERQMAEGPTNSQRIPETEKRVAVGLRNGDQGTMILCPGPDRPVILAYANVTALGYFQCGNIVVRIERERYGASSVAPEDVDKPAALGLFRREKTTLVAEVEAETKDLMEKVVSGLLARHACHKKVRGPMQIPRRDPREIDAVLDNLGLMLAAAAAAPPPRIGINALNLDGATRLKGSLGRRAPAAVFNWADAVEVAHTVHVCLLQLQHEAAPSRYNLTLTPEQLRRLKAQLHWVKWIYDRNSAAIDWWTGSLLADPTQPVSPNIPPPPEYPLGGPVPAKFGEVPWPWTSGPVAVEHLLRWEAIWEGSVNTAIDTAVLAAQVADSYYAHGCGFLVLTAGYSYYTGELTPLAWQVLSMAPIKYNKVPVGSAVLAALSAGEALTGYELHLKRDDTRWIPIKVEGKALESLRDVDIFDPATYPWQRIGKGSMTYLLGVSAAAEAWGGSRSGANARPRLGDTKIPMPEGPMGSLKEIGAPRSTPGGAVVTMEILQPTLNGWVQVKMEVLKVGEGAKVRYLHPETRKPLYLMSREGYHAYKHFYEEYPFGIVQEVRTAKVNVDRPKNTAELVSLGEPMTAAERDQVFRVEDNRVYQTVNKVDPATGAPAMENGKAATYAAEMPGLRDLFHDHPQLKDLVEAFDRVAKDPDCDPKAMREPYVRLMNGILDVFAKDRKTFTGYNAFFNELVTAHLVQHKGLDLYITLSPRGGLINAMVLSSKWNPANVAIGFKLQAGKGFEYGVTAKMGDLLDTLLIDPARSMRAYPREIPASRLRPERVDLLRATIKDALREDALRIYALGGAAFREDR